MSSLCTPEYNDETRKMMEQRDELSRIAKGAKEGDFGTAIRAKAKEIAGKGETDATSVRDQVHEWINQYAPHSKREVSDSISGYGREHTETKDVLQQRLNAINAELRGQSKAEDIASGKIPPKVVKTPDEVKNQSRQTALKREKADLEERLRTGDFDEPEKTPFVPDKETLRLRGEVAAVKRQIETLIHAREMKNRTWPRKTIDYFTSLHRAAILAGYHVLGKLASYTGAELGAAPLNSIVSEALRHVPGLRGTFEKAPRFGSGFSGEAEGAALKALVDKETWKRAGKQITQGFDNIDAQFGDKGDFQSAHPWLEFFGRLHAAEKTPLAVSEEARSRVLYQAQRLREIKAANPKITDEQAMQQVMQPDEQTAIHAKAYTRGQEAILKGDNKIVNGWKAAIRVLRGKEGDATGRLSNAIADFMEYHVPIVRVPSNLVDKLSSYTPIVGQAKAAFAAGALKDMTEAQAEYIAKNLTNSTIGSFLALVGWYGYKNISGYYQEGDNKTGREAETATVNGRTVPRAIFHHPATAVMQLWATVHRVYDEKGGGGNGAVSGGLAGARGAIEQLPFLDYITRQGTNFKDATSVNNWLGREVSELEPQFVKEIAKDTDPAKGRVAKGFVQQLKSGVPGLREQLPPR